MVYQNGVGRSMGVRVGFAIVEAETWLGVGRRHIYLMGVVAVSYLQLSTAVFPLAS